MSTEKPSLRTQVRSAVLILAAFSYILLIMEGLSNGLGVYRKPIFCWIALGCAAVGARLSPKTYQWFWAFAVVFAIGAGLFDHYKNNEWHRKLGDSAPATQKRIPI
jgi:hypothetical protein